MGAECRPQETYFISLNQKYQEGEFLEVSFSINRWRERLQSPIGIAVTHSSDRVERAALGGEEQSRVGYRTEAWGTSPFPTI